MGSADATFRSFWHGGPLTPLERLCITSFLAHGHGFLLYAYEDVANVPEGCLVHDARDVLPRERLFAHRSPLHAGSVAGFTSLFRYALLHEVGGWWADTDVLCLSGDVPGGEYVFAAQDEGLYNVAVVRLPAGSELARLARDRALERAGPDAPWAFLGPGVFTALVHELGLEDRAVPTSAIYPLHWREALDVLDPEQSERIAEQTSEATFVHLWNEVLRCSNVLKTVKPPADSYLARLYERFGVGFPPGPAYEWRDLAPQVALVEEYRRLSSEVKRLRAEVAKLGRPGLRTRAKAAARRAYASLGRRAGVDAGR